MKYPNGLLSPNTEFDQLKRDLETLSCGKKFPNKKDGGAAGLAKWVEYETNWDIAEEGILGNPNWTRESLGGLELKDLVFEADEVFLARKINASREQERQHNRENDNDDDKMEDQEDQNAAAEDSELDEENGEND
ncbi:hypothetical protein V8E51_008798 [Hyaloscypha variabilis]